MVLMGRGAMKGSAPNRPTLYANCDCDLNGAVKLNFTLREIKRRLKIIIIFVPNPIEWHGFLIDTGVAEGSRDVGVLIRFYYDCLLFNTKAHRGLPT